MKENFFAYISRMIYINRWSLMRNTLPENIQEQIDGFASYGKTNAEKIFRAGFYIGLNSKKIREELGIAD